MAMSDIGVGIIDTVWNCWRRTNHNDQSGESSRVEKCVRYVNITAPDHSDPQPANGRTANRERRGGGGVWRVNDFAVYTGSRHGGTVPNGENGGGTRLRGKT